MSTSPVFASTPRAALALISAANAGRDGTGTLVDLLSAGAGGTRVEHVDFVALGPTTAGMVRLFLHDGTSSRLFRELPVTAITPSESVASWSGSVNFSSLSAVLVLPSGWKLQVSTHNAESFAVAAFGGDF